MLCGKILDIIITSFIERVGTTTFFLFFAPLYIFSQISLQSAQNFFFALGIFPSYAVFIKSVATGPGQATVTEIPRHLSSAPSAREKERTYAFEAAYTENFFCGRKAEALESISIREPFFI